KEGWDAIPVEDRDGLTPAAPASPEYRRYLFDLVGAGPAGRATDAMDPSWDRFIRAQQCWDRAFACNIVTALEAPEAPLVVGIIGRGHLEYGGGAPFQLRDLGVEDVAVLLPSEAPEHDLSSIRGIGDAIFRLDAPEPPVDTAKRKRPTVADADKRMENSPQ
ncbi:MAG: ChaN family lipoprotein, partial [Paracoccaceae bacterium]